MKKYFFYVLCIALLGTVSVSAQKNDATADISRVIPQGKAFKVHNPDQDKTDLFEIQSIGTTTFTASNTVDGTTNSYKHSLQIVMVLIPVNKAVNNNFQLNFYSPGDNIQQAATYADGALNIYYPMAVYEDIRIKLEQAIATKKKVTVKVVQKTDGYREGTLVL